MKGRQKLRDSPKNIYKHCIRRIVSTENIVLEIAAWNYGDRRNCESEKGLETKRKIKRAGKDSKEVEIE
jgi:hypothetical protein